MSLFDVDIPRSADITIKIRFVAGRGKPFVAWEGSGAVNEAEVLEEICKSKLVHAYIKRATDSNRLKPDEEGTYKIPAKISCYDAGQMLEEKTTELSIYLLEENSEAKSSAGNIDALAVIKTLTESLTLREEHMQRMVDQVSRMHESYEKAVVTISKHSLESMDKVSNHAATAFSAAAAPFADMSKTLVKAIDDSRAHSSSSAKEAQDLLIEALKNRIVETNQASKPSIAQDIKDVMQLWPMFKGILGEVETKPQT